MDTDELIVRARQNCCRLCLAPDSECVPIFNSYAADKESISIKIETCVNIKVTQKDRLSSKICHFCISYLNSWQSFKNRCLASQAKQQHWLDIAAKNSSGKIKKSTTVQNKPSLYSNKKPMPLPIKQEPGEENENNGDSEKFEEEESMKVDLDPIQFCATKNDDDEEEEEQEETENNLSVQNSSVSPNCSDDPPILTSLGLTHITSVNPYSFLSTELGQQDANQPDAANDEMSSDNLKDPNDQISENPPIKLPKTLSSCSVCKLSFSTPANARRHERNIHGKHMNTSLSIFGGRKSLIKKSIATPEMIGIYDYTKPEKYRHLLTEQKLLFIRRNEEFLKQYQTLTCICCSKTHPTYKNFMAHMRKKYPTLGRNLCFKCLKQFQTKAMFVSHLKKKCCINLYKLYLSDDTIPKDGTLQISPDKMGAKDLLTNKIYECKLCSKTARLKVEFRTHVNENHSDIQKKDVLPGHCGFCATHIEDPIERKRHFNNMECIVSLKCVTCGDKFDNHQLFVDHVYEAHLPHHQMNEGDCNIIPDVQFEEEEDEGRREREEEENSDQKSQLINKLEPQIKEMQTLRKIQYRPIDSRSPQSCKICGAHYNNYNNVLRHMEAKHPDQLPETYKCTMCDAGFARMSMLRGHMSHKHGKKVPKHTRRDIQSGINENKMKFECKMCLDTFLSVDKWISHQSEIHAHFVCFQCNFQNRNSDEFKKHIETHSKVMGETSVNSTNNTATIIQSTNDSKTTNRYDYIMKDLLAIRNGIKLQEELNSDGKTQDPPQKKMKMDVDLKECQICHAVFNSNLGLSNHMRTHNAQQQQEGQIKGVHVSPKIPKSSKISSKIHFGVTASDLLRRIRCRHCPKRFSTKKVFRRHMLIEHKVEDVEFIKCSICKADFIHEKGLKLHMMRVHDVSFANTSSATTINSQFECNECQLIFKNEEQLNTHTNFAHNQEEDKQEQQTETSMPSSRSSITSVAQFSQSAIEANYWFQCRYCPAHFDTNKKLAIHTNSHDEFDSNDYSCKDCGNVYSGRKSLWVHRYKKHPLVPDPSTCIICKKTFFDKNMLEMHMKNYSHTNILNKTEDSQLEYDQDQEMYDITDDFENDEIDREDENKDCSEDNTDNTVETDQQKQLIEVRCTMCYMKFTDVDLFSKHMTMHEMELYTDNPLAAMFDTGPEDPNKFYESRLGENGEYVCDICPKTFPMLTAFKVHRNWHFRSDGKQVPADPNTTWRGVQRKKKDPATSVKCQYCNSLFISDNNLKRHIMELHRRETSNGEAPKMFIEKFLECKRCEMKFRFKGEWISHKLEHVKSSTVDPTFGWGCEICGKIVSRKERLIQHVRAHLKEEDSTQKNDDENYMNRSDGDYKLENSEEFESNSQDSNSIDATSDRANYNITEERNINKSERQIIAHVTSDGAIMRSYDNVTGGDLEDDDEENDSDINTSTDNSGDEEESMVESENDDEPTRQHQLYSCDLCHVNFETTKDLQLHVTSHFLNGPGSVTLTETEKKSEDEET